MTEPKWTPGPWKVGPASAVYDGQISSFVDPHQVAISGRGWTAFAKGVVRMKTAEREFAEGRANANLIAAAPDMAEALDWILNDPKIQTGIGGNPNYVEEGIARARAALAKARGES